MRRPEDAAIHAQAVISESVVVSDSVVAAGVHVGAQASVAHSVLLNGCVVGDGAVIEDSIVMGHVGNDARLIRCIVGPTGVVQAGQVVSDGRFPNEESA
jgi:ADP-glucose pyrophosphorylase